MQADGSWRFEPVAVAQPLLRSYPKSFLREIAHQHLVSKTDLVMGLERAFFLKQDGVLPRDRKRYFVALANIANFMKVNRFPAPVIGELLELAFALLELDDGRTREMLKATNTGKKGRKHDPGDIWQARALFAIGLDVMINHARIDKSEAVEYVAKHCDIIGECALSADMGTFKGALAKWHQDFTARYGCEARAQETFDNRESLIDATRRDADSDEPIIVAGSILALATMMAGRAATPAAVERIKKRLPQPGAGMN